MNNVNTDNLISKIIELPRGFRGVMIVDRSAGIDMRSVSKAFIYAWKGIPKDQIPKLSYFFTNDVEGVKLFNLEDFSEVTKEIAPVTLDTSIYE